MLPNEGKFETTSDWFNGVRLSYGCAFYSKLRIAIPDCLTVSPLGSSAGFGRRSSGSSRPCLVCRMARSALRR
jgi:hypothetical protein